MVSASLSQNWNPSADLDYDLVIIGPGVGGQGAALHAVDKATFVEALDQLMLGFDPEIGKLAQRVINPREIDCHTGVFVSKITPTKDGKPVIIELIDAKTKEPKDTLEVDATLIAIGKAPFTKGLGLENINVETQRGFIPVDERMHVLDASGKLVPNLYFIGDANGKLMLTHAASAQGISVVEQVTRKDNVLSHLSIQQRVSLTQKSARLDYWLHVPLHKFSPPLLTATPGCSL